MNKWTDEMTEYMIDLITESKTFEQVAKEINKKYGTTFTRNAIAGKWNRFTKKHNYY